MKLTDIILIIFVGIFAIGLMFYTTNGLITDDNKDYEVEIRVDGEIYETYSIDDEQFVHIDTEYGFNDIQIQEGEVSIVEADCNDQICVETKAANRPGQSIVCLPHRVSIEIRGIAEEESEVDDISQ